LDPAPVQVPPAFCAPLIAIFESVSVKVAAVSALVFVFDRVKVSVDVPPTVIVAGLKAFEIVGFVRTVRSTDAEPVPKVVCDVVIPLVLLGCVPTVLEVTSTVTVQLPLAGIVRPLNVRLV
jgi:hypothetical protein